MIFIALYVNIATPTGPLEIWGTTYQHLQVDNMWGEYECPGLFVVSQQFGCITLFYVSAELDSQFHVSVHE